jgi:ubiquinone/menaquinone biosynthesis C-methylase UbiE
MKNTNKIYNLIAKQYSEIYGNPTDHVEYFLNMLPKKSKILDIGCGAGINSKLALIKGFSVIGLDSSKEMIKIAKHNFPKIKFNLADMNHIEYNTKQFSGIIASFSLIHIPKNKIPSIIKKFSEILKGNGMLYLSLQSGRSKEIFINGPFIKGEKLFLNIMSFNEIKKVLNKYGFNIIWSKKRKPNKNEIKFDKLFIIAKND